MNIFKLSTPTQAQIIHSIERVVGVFVVTAITVWSTSGSQFNKAALWAAGVAGATAAYQVLSSIFTTL